MRLKQFEVQAIKDVVHEYFPVGSSVSLFGSRTDDSARGGDIDLFIQTDLSGMELQDARIRTMAGISLRIGDQKIDIVCSSGKEKEKSLIILEAQRTSIPL
jgi:hypothetical protein